MNNKKNKLTHGQCVDVIPPQKGTIVDSEKGTNVETWITRERVDLFDPCFFRVVGGVDDDFLRPWSTP